MHQVKSWRNVTSLKNIANKMLNIIYKYFLFKFKHNMDHEKQDKKESAWQKKK